MASSRLRVTRKAWFGPKRVGWGLSPRSWQGWLTIAAFVAAFWVSLSVWHSILAGVACLAALAAVILLTSDPPGGSFGRR